jgi:uncharacterized membrane protein (DUF106 family)
MAKKRDIKSIFDLGPLTSKLVINNLTFVLFIGFLTMVYIANAHYAEGNVRRIQTLQKELRELKWYYMSLQSENMYNAKRSEVLKRVKEDGLRVQTQAPKRILVDKDNYQ